MSTFSERLKESMQAANMKAVELHELTGISKASISEYLSGNYEPKQQNIFKIAKALNVSPSYLMGIEYVVGGVKIPEVDIPPQSERNPKAAAFGREITHIMEEMKKKLMQEKGLMFDGEPASPESIQSIFDAMRIGMEMVRERNKKKFTPKKFTSKKYPRKDSSTEEETPDTAALPPVKK